MNAHTEQYLTEQLAAFPADRTHLQVEITVNVDGPASLITTGLVVKDAETSEWIAGIVPADLHALDELDAVLDAIREALVICQRQASPF